MRPRQLTSLAAALATSLTLACSQPAPLGPDLQLGPGNTVVLRLVNETAAPIGWVAVDLETSHLVDPAPSFTVGPENSHRIVAAGGTAPLTRDEIMGYRSEGAVRFFLYRVVGERAELRGMATRTQLQIALNDARVEISERDFRPHE